MATATFVSPEQYLATSYRPDCDYVDGEVLERILGTKDHSRLQRELLLWFGRIGGLAAFPEQRIRVSSGRFRVPDVCVTGLPEPDEQVFTRPPYICIEVLSPEDTFPRLQQRLDDYLDFGVPNIWVLDPSLRRAWRVTREGHFEALDGVLRTQDSSITMPIAELFPAAK